MKIKWNIQLGTGFFSFHLPSFFRARYFQKQCNEGDGMLVWLSGCPNVFGICHSCAICLFQTQWWTDIVPNSAHVGIVLLCNTPSSLSQPISLTLPYSGNVVWSNLMFTDLLFLLPQSKTTTWRLKHFSAISISRTKYKITRSWKLTGVA